MTWPTAVALLEALGVLAACAIVAESQRQLSAARDLIRRQNLRLAELEGAGPCPVDAPGSWAGIPPSRCSLKAGHDGDHLAEDGTERWGTYRTRKGTPDGQ